MNCDYWVEAYLVKGVTWKFLIKVKNEEWIVTIARTYCIVGTLSQKLSPEKSGLLTLKNGLDPESGFWKNQDYPPSLLESDKLL